MEFRQFKDGSCDIVFSWREKFIILKKGKIHLSPEAVKHFGNNLVKIVSDWQLNLNEELQNKLTYEDTKIDSK